VLQGTATLNLSGASVTALDGDVNPGTSPGALTVTSALPLSALSAVNIELNGTTAGSQYDQLNVLGRATFGGVLNITAGFTPVVGDQFTVATFSGGRAGGFTAINGLDLGGGIVLDTVWTATALTLEVPAPKIVFAGDSSGGLSTGIFTVNADSTGHVYVDTLIPLGYQRQFPRWSPDRNRIAYSWDAGVFGPLQLFVTSKAAGGLPQAVVTDTSTFRPRWNPSGMRLAFECGNGFSIVDVCVIGDVTGPIGSLPVNTYVYVSKAAGIPPAWQGGQSGFSWDPQNPDRLVFARDSTDVNDVSMLWTANYDGSGVQRLAPDGLKRPSDGADLVVYGPLDYSPNGQQIVFAAYSPVDAIPMEKLFVINRDGTGLRQLTFQTGYDDSPLFSPDGSEVAFGRDLCASTGAYDGWIVDMANTDGTLERRITDHGGVTCDFDTDLLGGDWSPDGSEIVLNGFDAMGNLLIYVAPSTVRAATYLTDRKLVGRGVDLGGFVQDIQPSWRP
jgi:Tol biopolymer transport system component